MHSLSLCKILAAITNVLERFAFAFGTSFSFNMVGDTNNADFTDVTGQFLHSR